jgi:hypothetical protein
VKDSQKKQQEMQEQQRGRNLELIALGKQAKEALGNAAVKAVLQKMFCDSFDSLVSARENGDGKIVFQKAGELMFIKDMALRLAGLRLSAEAVYSQMMAPVVNRVSEGSDVDMADLAIGNTSDSEES